MKMFTIQIKSIMKPSRFILVLFSFCFIGAYAQVSPTDIIPAGSTVTKLSSNQYQFLEGPVWYNDSVLLFVDDAIGSPNIFQYNPVGKQVKPLLQNVCFSLAKEKIQRFISFFIA